MFVIIKKGEIVGTKGVSQNHLLSFDDNKVLKNYQLDMLNICSSVQDPNQSTIHKDSDWTSQRAKEYYWSLELLEEMHLKKSVWRNASEETSLKKELLKTRHQKQGYQKHLTRSYFTRVDKVQCTKFTTTNSAHASATTISATCLYINTRIPIILLQTLFRFIWNGFEISSS